LPTPEQSRKAENYPWVPVIAYLWRWEIEVNFREEKSILGCGQAQVRNPNSAQIVPAFISAIYAMLHLAAHRAFKSDPNQILPRPKWYPKKEQDRHSTGEMSQIPIPQLCSAAETSQTQGLRSF
jgi:hypothetical protein